MGNYAKVKGPSQMRDLSSNSAQPDDTEKQSLHVANDRFVPGPPLPGARFAV